MATFIYRPKPADPTETGGFIRGVGNSPVEVTGLTDGILYQWDDGADRAPENLPEIMPGVAPSVAVAPTISGARVGQTPTANAGTYNGSPAPTITPGDLQLDGVTFSGTLQAADEGKTLTYTGETATNPLDSVTAANVSETVIAGIDAATQDYIDRVEVQDGQALEEDVKLAFDKFFRGLKADGTYASLGVTCILAGARTINGAIEPLNSAMAQPTQSNFLSGSYSRKTGLKGNGIDEYIDSQRPANSDGQNNVSMGVYISDLGIETGRRYVNASGELEVVRGITGSLEDFRARVATTTLDQITGSAASSGFIGVSRSLSTEYDWVTPVSSGTQATASTTAPPATNYNIYRQASGSGYTDARIAFFNVGPAINLIALRGRVNTLITDLDAAIV